MITAADQAIAESKAKLADAKARAALTDAQILKTYCDGVRAQAAAEAKMIQDYLDQQAADAAYVHKYGTDEG